jgi:spore germination cell wall hydrolase CwlJ-like protein
MPAYGKLTIAVIGAAALSGTTIVPATQVLAAPAPMMAAVELPADIQEVAEAPAAAPKPIPAAAPVQDADEAAAQDEAQASISERELDCMTKVILYEAGAESRAGQIAVAQVVLNRAKSGRFPRTVCGVIHQPGQFSSIRSYKAPGGARWDRAESLARAVMTGDEDSPVGNALYFHATRVSPAYVRSRTRVATIGNHVFYR